jgi:hypothetical protein
MTDPVSRFANYTSKLGRGGCRSDWLMYFVHRMLEDPSYESIVRWGEGGESFVVLEVRN